MAGKYTKGLHTERERDAISDIVYRLLRDLAWTPVPRLTSDVTCHLPLGVNSIMDSNVNHSSDRYCSGVYPMSVKWYSL